MKKKIAVVDLLFNWPPDGGARTDVKEIITQLANDYEISLFVPQMNYYFPRGRNAEQIKNIKVVKINTNPIDFNIITFPKILKNKINQFNPDLIFFTDGWFLKPGLINYFKNYKYIVRFYAYEGLCLKQHGMFFRNNKICNRDYLKESFLEWIKCSFCAIKWLLLSRNKLFIQEYIASLAFLPRHKKTVIKSLENAKAIICYNSFIKNKIKAFNPNIYIVPSGINSKQFPFIEKKYIPLKHKENINILMVGRIMDPVKGYSTLKKAFKIIQKKYPNTILHVTAERDFFENNNNIIVHKWSSQKELPGLYKNADICIVPSIWPEPFGIITLEAMSSGIPVIVSNVAGPKSVIEHKKNGLIFNPGDHTDLAKKIELLIQNSNLYLTLREQAKKDARQFEWDKIYSKIKSIFDSYL